MEGHGIFLRPSQVKSLDTDKSILSAERGFDSLNNLDNSVIKNPNQGAASFISGGPSAFGIETGNSNPDMLNIDSNFSLGQKDPISKMGEAMKEAVATPGAGGRVKGWKERLAKMREQKEA